jgi:serine/threonine protein kinase
LGFNKLVVVKRLRSTLSDEASYLEMFLDEARLAARLNHPNVVHTYEVGEHEGAYFIAMEYLEGQPLNKIIRELAKRGEELEPPQCARIVSDALLGLHHAHELKDYDGTPLRIVHRDVSPHNVFVTYDGQVKLVDFGIAKAGLSSTETEVGVLKGKVAYMSPEQALGIELDRRADLFSMGIVLWELLTRKRLMQGDSAASTLHHILNSPIARVSSVLPRIDPELDAVVAKALDKNPDHRFQDALAMREALERWIRVTGQNVRQEEIGERVSTMFDAVRADVKRQIQQHMAAVATATSPQELAQLSLDRCAGSTAEWRRRRPRHSSRWAPRVPPAAGAASSRSGRKSRSYPRTLHRSRTIAKSGARCSSRSCCWSSRRSARSHFCS